MSRSRRLVPYAAFSAAAFLSALVLGRPELAALGAPFALFLVVGLSLPAPPPLRARLRLPREQMLEDEEIEAELVVPAPETACTLRLSLDLPDGIELAGGTSQFLLRLEPGRERVLSVRLVAARWGIHRLGGSTARTGDRASVRLRDLRTEPDSLMRVYPRPQRLQSLIRPLETQPFAGNRVARAKGEGIEFADVRPYAPGDRVRRINWRESARRQTLHVNQQHPERNGDVILFLDSFTEAPGRAGSTLDLAVRAAASLADHYLGERDRVGLVSWGGLMRWLVPAAGTIQLYRIVEALLQTEIVFSHYWRDIDVLPARSLTPQALIIAISPLLDERGMNAMLDLRGRGFDLVLVDVSPLVARDEPLKAPDRRALRLWQLWREALHYRYERLGVATVVWDGTEPLGAAVEEVRAFRRFARFASA
ncbi:MAG: DUF58 domain-containing protein [Gaiellaceae bacterium]